MGTLTFSLIFPQETMYADSLPGNHGISEYLMEDVSVNLRRDVDENAGTFNEVTTIGIQPRSFYQGRQPKVLRLSITFDKSSKDLRTFAATLDRKVPCVNNIFMPGMKVTVTSSLHSNIEVGSEWYVDVFSTSRSNNRGPRFDAELILFEYVALESL